MAVNNFGNGYQPTSGVNGNNYGNNYNYNSNVTPMVTMPVNPPPAIIAFVHGRMGAGNYPIMSSNTTAYLFDVEDQTKFYIKQTDAFGMVLPLRQCTYHEDVLQPQALPVAIPNVSQNSSDAKSEVEHSDSVSKEEFEELKAQLSALADSMQKQNYQQNKPRKERQNNV